MSTRSVIEKWYKTLEFPAEYDGEFYEALDTIEIPQDTAVENYHMKCEDGKKNLLAFLYMCQRFQEQSRARNIPEDVIVETLKDLVIWTKVYTDLKGTLYLGELGWLRLHMQFEMFRLGRLQFRMNGCCRDIPEVGLKKGDPIMEIHIPRGSKLDIEECHRSFAWAKEFFSRHFPEYSYDYFTCNSWLLDEDLKEYLPATSNILRFGDLFTRVYAKEFNCLLSSVFRDDTTEENLPQAIPTTAFAQKVKDAVLGGKKFHMTLGILKK